MTTMTMGEAILLGVLQGLAEFLPISSSGHLVIGQHYLGIEEPALLFDIMLHVGTLFAIMVYFRADIFRLLYASMSIFEQSLSNQMDESKRMIGFIIVASIPTALIGFIFKDSLTALFANVTFVASMLYVTAFLTWATDRIAWADNGVGRMKLWHALMIGIAQGCSITPGITRSGSTIFAATLLGINRETAARFSFLISIPAIVGALLLELRDIEIFPDSSTWIVYGGGTLAAFITGLVAIFLVMKLLNARKFYWFSLYCVALGSFVLFSEAIIS